jgi:hypothetical protein
MKTIYLLVFAAVMLISFSGCKNKGTKDSNVRYGEASYDVAPPDELKKFASIEFVSQDGSKIKLHLQTPVRINESDLPLLEFADTESERLHFSTDAGMSGRKSGITFTDSVGSERAVLRMGKNIPTGFQLIESGQDHFYTVTCYTTFEIYEGEEDEYFDAVFAEIEQKSSQVDKIPQAVKNLLPSNYELSFCATGNLNRDEYDDAILIFGSQCCDCRCWILTGTPDNSYKITVVNDNIALGAGYFGDKRDFEQPFFDIVIKNGFFTFEQYGGVRGNNKSMDLTHFKYSKEDDNWLLYRSDYIPSRFLAGNCCYDFHETTYYVEKILFEEFR